MHVPRTLVHVTRGRQTTIVSDPIAGLNVAGVSAVELRFDGEPAISCTFADDPAGLVVTGVVTAAYGAGLPLGLVHWQMLPTLTTGSVLADPVAEGLAYVTDPVEVGA